MFDELDRASLPDLLEAYGDALAIRAGYTLGDESHPLAYDMRDGNFTAAELARRLARLPHGAGPGEINRALNSSDFGDSLQTALQRIVGLAWGAAAGPWDDICQTLPSRGVRPVECPTVELGELTALPRNGSAELIPIDVESGNVVTPQRFGFRFAVSRELLVNDETALAAAWVAHLTTQSARLLPRLIGGILTANPALGDSSPFIGAGNTTSATGLSVTALGEAFEKIRTATTPGGQVSAAAPRFLLVPPARELAARILIASASVGADAPVSVLCNCWAGSDSYLIADPSEAPTFGVTYPGSSSRRPRVYRVPPRIARPDGTIDYYDGQQFEFETLFGVGAINRLGIVRIPAA